MIVDTLIKGGRVIDPSRNIDEIRDIAIENGRIAEIPSGEEVRAKFIMNAEGCIVIPGMIDAHQHINYHSADWGNHPDLSCIPYGITTVADAGTSGASNCMAFMDRLSQFAVKSRIYMNASPLGQATLQFNEPLRPEEWDVKRMERGFEYGNGRVIGLKIRLSKGIVSSLDPLEKLIPIAKYLNTKILVHPTNAPEPQAEILKLLREGDVYCHLYHGRGANILDEKRKVIPELYAAKERGVVLDAAHGMANFNFDVAERAMDQGIFPDVISSDTTSTNCLRRPMYCITDIMSKFLLLGMPLQKIIAAVTSTPAKVLGVEQMTGSLAPGCCGDVCVLKIKNSETTLVDCEMNERKTNQVFVTQAVFLDGQLSYRSAEFFEQ